MGSTPVNSVSYDILSLALKHRVTDRNSLIMASWDGGDDKVQPLEEIIVVPDQSTVEQNTRTTLKC